MKKTTVSCCAALLMLAGGFLLNTASAAPVVFNFQTESVGGLKAIGTVEISMTAVDGVCTVANGCILSHTFTAPVDAVTMVPLPGASVDTGASILPFELTLSGSGTPAPSVAVASNFLSSGGGGFEREAVSIDMGPGSMLSGTFFGGNDAGGMPTSRTFTSGTLTAVPEPSSFLFLGLVLAAIGFGKKLRGLSLVQ